MQGELLFGFPINLARMTKLEKMSSHQRDAVTGCRLKLAGLRRAGKVPPEKSARPEDTSFAAGI